MDEDLVRATCCNFWVPSSEIVWREGEYALCNFCKEAEEILPFFAGPIKDDDIRLKEEAE